MKANKKMAVGLSVLMAASVMNIATIPALAEDDDKVITFWNVGTEGADLETYELAIKQFNENTTSGYTIENIPTQNDKYKEKLVIAMSSGECPDMYTTWSGGPMDQYIDAGYAQPIDDLASQYKLQDKYMEGALAQATYKDQLYAIPVKNISVAGIYYNKALFEQYGIEVPKTVSELEAAADTFVENGIVPFTLANGPKWTGSMYFQQERVVWNRSRKQQQAREALRMSASSTQVRRFRSG